MLVIGFGNPGRGDDGLGPAFAEAIEGRYPGVEVDSDYQLTVEDAAEVARHGTAVFVDAACQGEAPFVFEPLAYSDSLSFTTHHVNPGAVMTLARDLFHARTQGYLLAIRGYGFDTFGEGLSEAARRNLDLALAYFETWVRERGPQAELAGPEGNPPAGLTR